MHFMKTVLSTRLFNVRSAITRQVLFVKRSISSAGQTVEETKSQTSSVGDGKKTMKGPFLKNIFAGVFDSEILEYPEYPSLEYTREVDRLTKPVEEYVYNCVDSKAIDETKEIPEEHIKTLKEHYLYGLKVPKHLGGLEIDDKCFARYFESIGTDVSITTSLNSHYRALNALLMFGTEEQKEKLIPKLVSGEVNIAVCITEKPNLLSVWDMDTTALPNKDDNWTLNGKKIWIPNGDKADYFLVFAKTSKGSLKIITGSELTLFLIDKNTPGVECSTNIDQLGTRGVSLCDVTFKNVVVPKENSVGEIGDGTNIAMQCLSKGRLGSAAASVNYLKNLLTSVAEFTAQTKISNKPLYTMEFYQKMLGDMAIDIYALESMVYLTAGLSDMYADADLTVEEAAVKIFSMEKVVEIVDSCVNLVGGSAYIKGSPLERYIRDSRSYLVHDVVPVNVSKLHLSTLGLQHAGIAMQTEIKKARNPLNFPAFALKNLFSDQKASGENIKIPEVLRLTLHPSLSGDADKLERIVLRLEYIVKNLFQRWGVEIVDRHADLIKLADCVIRIYGMVAVLSRASRSYCIGLPNSNFDLTVTNVFCSVNYKTISDTFESIYYGPMDSYETPTIAIGEQISLQKGYFFQHPLARNY